MAKAPECDNVQKWNELMVKWSVANKAYEVAVARLCSSSGETQAESASAVSIAMQELKELKREIDKLIKHARQDRLQVPGTLLMATIEPKQTEPQTDFSPQDSIISSRDPN